MYFLAYKAVYFVNYMQVVERAMYAIHDQTTSHHTTLGELPLHVSANNKLWIDDLMMIYMALLQKTLSLQKLLRLKSFKTNSTRHLPHNTKFHFFWSSICMGHRISSTTQDKVGPQTGSGIAV